MGFEVRTEVWIDAPARVVWAVLTEVERWHEWTQWLRYESGRVAVGERLALRLTPPDGGGYAFSPEIISLEPERHFAWVGRTGVRGVFDGEHHFELEALNEGTRVANWERYSGVLAPLMRHLPAMRGAEQGFRAMNEELRRAAESRREAA